MFLEEVHISCPHLELVDNGFVSLPQYHKAQVKLVAVFSTVVNVFFDGWAESVP